MVAGFPETGTINLGEKETNGRQMGEKWETKGRQKGDKMGEKMGEKKGDKISLRFCIAPNKNNNFPPKGSSTQTRNNPLSHQEEDRKQIYKRKQMQSTLEDANHRSVILASSSV